MPPEETNQPAAAPQQTVVGPDAVADVTKILSGEGGAPGEIQAKPDAGESSKTPDEGASAPEPGQSMDELLADPAKPDAQAKPSGDTAKAPATLAELAEIAGVSVEDIYKLQVPMADGQEPVTLGTMKDQRDSMAQLETDQELFATRQTEFENGMITAKAELAEVLQLLGDKIPPALIAKAKQQHLDTIATEAAALYEVMPAWADADTYNQAKDTMMTLVSRYGFTRADLDSVHNHKFTKLIYDAAKNQQRIDQANAAMKEIRGGGKKVNKVSSKASPAKPDKPNPGDTSGQVAAISQVLENAK